MTTPLRRSLNLTLGALAPIATVAAIAIYVGPQVNIGTAAEPFDPVQIGKEADSDLPGSSVVVALEPPTAEPSHAPRLADTESQTPSGSNNNNIEFSGSRELTVRVPVAPDAAPQPTFSGELPDRTEVELPEGVGDVIDGVEVVAPEQPRRTRTPQAPPAPSPAASTPAPADNAAPAATEPEVTAASEPEPEGVLLSDVAPGDDGWHGLNGGNQYFSAPGDLTSPQNAASQLAPSGSTPGADSKSSEQLEPPSAQVGDSAHD